MALSPFGWHDGPAGGTPLSSAELEAFGLYIANYFDNGTSSLGSPSTLVHTGTAYTGTVIGGTGDSLNYAGTATSGQFYRAFAGTAGTPDTSLNPLGKFTRTVSLLAANVAGDGAEQASAGGGIATSDTANQVQTVGWYGIAVNNGTAKGGSGSPDGCGVYGVGRVLGSAVGIGMGAFFRGESGSSSGSLSAVQIQAYNNRGSDDSIATTAFPSSSGIWMWADGPNRSSQGVTLANPFGRQFDGGIVFNGQTGATRTDANCVTNSTTTVTDSAVLASDVGRTVTGSGIPANTVILSVIPATSFVMSNAATTSLNPVSLVLAQVGPTRTADIQSNSTASTGILINGTHSTAAMAVASGSGALVVGGTSTNQSALLEVQSTVAKRPLFSIGHSTAAGALSMFIVNTAGTSEYFVSNSTDGVLTGTVAGDGGVRVVTSAKFFHIGGTTSTIKVGQANTLGFFNATAVAQQSGVGTATGYTAGATTATFHSDDTYTGNVGTRAFTVNGVVAALKNLGLLASS